MLIKRIYDEKLAQASYLVACSVTREALVVDPNRDVRQYLDAARAEGVRITHVTETHIHADFASGSRELAAEAGAQLLLSDEGGAGWRYAFAPDAGAALLRDGDTVMVGRVRVDAVHTPGHTPEHLTFLVTDTATADRPAGALTGDFIFAGDVGRPDLLERAAGVGGTMEESARRLFRSLGAFAARFPDWLQLWPGHGAGSACGKALGQMPQTTLGYERLFNWAFGIADEDEFVRAVLAGQPDPPRYFARMKRLNRDGVPAHGPLRAPPRVTLDDIQAAVAAGAQVLDTRPTSAFVAGYLAGTVHLPFNRSFITWAGAIAVPDRPIYLVADESHAGAAARDLALIALDDVRGFLPAEALERHRAEGGALETLAAMTPDELAVRLGHPDVAVVDVRNAAEYEAGHLPGVPNLPLGRLEERAGDIPRDRPVVLHCQGGTRSVIAASLLAARGYRDLVNLTGGYGAWAAAGHPVERPGVPEDAPTGRG
jgi:hydroxyacylglutathione hydrolase